MIKKVFLSVMCFSIFDTKSFNTIANKKTECNLIFYLNVTCTNV